MSSSNLVRWGGLAAMPGGALGIVLTPRSLMLPAVEEYNAAYREQFERRQKEESCA